MIGALPTQLEVNDIFYPIRSDFRDCLVILQAYNDPELSKQEQQIIMLQCLYKEWEKIPAEDIEEALHQAIWFLNCGDTISSTQNAKPLYDWEQDEQLIFSAINKVAGKETRSVDYMHFWTFIGLFNEIGDCAFSSIVSIRNKRNKHKKLDKSEQEFYRDHKDMIDLKKKYTREDLEQLAELEKLLNQ